MSRPKFDDFQAICETKARYCRSLDTKDWAVYADVFTPAAVLDTRPSGGSKTTGRDNLVEMVRSAIGKATTVHQVHSPEVDMIDDENAIVIWSMQDRVIWDEDKAQAIDQQSLTGYGHYHEKYVRCTDGIWRISESRLTRLHMDFEPFVPKNSYYRR